MREYGKGIQRRLKLVKVGYHVFGVDSSESMIAIARTRVPEAEFQVESLFNVDIPACNAVTSIGECLNYLFDPKSDRASLIQLFYRIYNALEPGGVFIFDIVEPGQVAPGIPSQGFTEGEDWVVLVEKLEDREQELLTRRIITFRKVGKYYRRDEEVHYQRLYQGTDIAEQLRQVGFEVQTMRSYGEYPLPKSRVAFIARQPT
ncbi:MAG: class I SAM-dependent methyltransferase [Coleofasciculus sp. G3-WIS-01]|uniref:class I SAM-dependent methyltransferase n=1 Tax=Coleofasciculus sp. G3-WIS-01 TaxID=3069528 RepID=UPI003300D057